MCLKFLLDILGLGGKMDKWFNVNEVAQIWSGHSDNHQKMGKLYPPAAIRAIDEYGGSYQFAEFKVVDAGYSDLDPLTTSYPQYWIRAEDVSVAPYEEPSDDPGDDPGDDPDPDPEPDPEGPSDAEIGRVIRFLFSGKS